MTEPQPEDDQRARKMGRAYLVLSPFGGALAYGLAALQGADTRTCLIISGAALGLCLFFALLHSLRGSRATGDLAWINTILRVLTRR